MSDQDKQSGCSAGCSHCSGGHDGPPEAGELTGGRLVAASAGTFVTPIAAAVAGALLLPQYVGWAYAQYAGAVGGLFAGMALTVVVAGFLKKKDKDSK